MLKRMFFSFIVIFALGGVSLHASLYTGSLSTPSGSGMFAGGQTWAYPPGFRLDWEVTQTTPSTWHYKYTFTDENGGELSMLVSHMIISLSDNIQKQDLFNFDTYAVEWGIGTFGLHSGNKEVLIGEIMFGMKLSFGFDQMVAEFDSSRQPMWGDIFATGHAEPKNYAFNVDLGVEVANPHDYDGVPVDASGKPLHKILVPNSIPEPCGLLLLSLGAMILRKRKA